MDILLPRPALHLPALVSQAVPSVDPSPPRVLFRPDSGRYTRGDLGVDALAAGAGAATLPCRGVGGGPRKASAKRSNVDDTMNAAAQNMVGLRGGRIGAHASFGGSVGGRDRPRSGAELEQAPSPGFLGIRGSGGGGVSDGVGGGTPGRARTGAPLFSGGERNLPSKNDVLPRTTTRWYQMEAR